MNIELTQLTAEEYNLLLSGHMTPAMAAEYLREERITLREFHTVLQNVYPHDDLQSRLTTAFQMDSPNINPDSVSRKIRNWLSGQSQPTKREDIFRIAFALELSEGQTNLLLGLCTDYGIHYRNGRDVVYAWFLRTGREYAQARDFFQTLPPVPRPDLAPDNPPSHLTRSMQNEFLRIHTLDELRACYQNNLRNFGYLHLRAYTYFRRYLDQLIHPSPTWGHVDEPDYSMEAVMKIYLSLCVPSGKDLSQYSLVQKLIKRNWPNTTSLKNIYNRKEDVPRKLLLLLYVITENLLDEDYTAQYQEYDSREARLEDHWWTLNAILTDCGMPLIDPRNATDWLVLYAITATDEPMSERMEQVIARLFADKPDP